MLCTQRSFPYLFLVEPFKKDLINKSRSVDGWAVAPPEIQTSGDA